MHETISLAGLVPGLCCFPVNSGGGVLTSPIGPGSCAGGLASWIRRFALTQCLRLRLPRDEHHAKKERTGSRYDARIGRDKARSMRQVLLAYPGSVPVWTSIDRFKRNGDSIRQHMATLMISFLAGLFVGLESSKRSGTISISSGGSACPKATRDEFTVIATRGFESFKTDQH